MPRYSVYTEYVFEWDPRKAEANAAKHGVSFDDAVTVFLDANALDGPDVRHSEAEARLRLHTQEKRQCRNDPAHQRAAGESPRTRGVRREGLTTLTFPTRRPSNSERCDAWVALHSVTNRVS